jgi:hypothetical protein
MDGQIYAVAHDSDGSIPKGQLFVLAYKRRLHRGQILISIRNNLRNTETEHEHHHEFVA